MDFCIFRLHLFRYLYHQQRREKNISGRMKAGTSFSCIRGMRTMNRITLVFRVICFLGCLQLLVMGVSASDILYHTNATQSAGSWHIPDKVSATSAAAPLHPASPVKLIFIHHSTGQNWLADDNGGLGIALRNNNYFVSDTNYGWGPDSIGDSTDIGNWYDWFRGPNSPTYLAALYIESGQHSPYSRLATDPGGPNRIVMFKSCFPNSALQGNPADPVPPISSNPLRSLGAGSEYHTVANAKGIYIDLLEYFKTRQDTLFVVIAAPPLSDATYAKNARVFNQWLVNDWLKNYPYKNVYVFDFYNVLTSNGGNANTNDLGQVSGNHHRWWNGAVQHQFSKARNTTAYPSGDDHPSQAGNLKATGEYVPLLNYAYNQWTESTLSSKIGVFRPAMHRFYLKNGTANNTMVNWGLSTDKPVTGDWNGNGLYDVGVFRNSTHTFYLKNGTANTSVNWGLSTDLPVTGDWNGDGLWDVGVFRPSTHTFYLKNGTANTSVNFGLSMDRPVTGDWNNDGLWDIGVHHNATRQFQLKNGSVTTVITFGLTPDTPLTGKWAL